MALLEQVIARQQTSPRLSSHVRKRCDTAGVLQETQREILLLTLVEKLEVGAGAAHGAYAGHAGDSVIAHGVKEPRHAITLGRCEILLSLMNDYPFRVFNCACRSITLRCIMAI